MPAFLSSSPQKKKRYFVRFASSMIAWSALATLAPEWAAAQDDDESSTASSEEVVITEKARAHFKAGVNLLQDPGGARYEEAYDQFKAAYAESPSWKILGNLGLAAMNLERYGEAIDAFSEYLEVGGDSLAEQERTQYQRDLETMRAGVATLTINAPPGAELTDIRRGNRGEQITNYYLVPESGTLTLRVRPGQHEISAASKDAQLAPWSVRLAASSSSEHSFGTSQEPPVSASSSEPDDRPSRVPAYVALGVGAVGVGVGVGFLAVRGGHNKKATTQYDDCIKSGVCGDTEQGDIEDLDKKAATAGTISLVSFGVGAVGIGAGIALLVMNTSGPENPVEMKVGKTRLAPFVGYQQLGLVGSF